MSGQTPLETVEQLIQAFHNLDVEQALSQYEPEGALVTGPGQVAIGTEALRSALEQVIALKPTLTTASYEIIEAGNTALYCSNWNMTGTAPDGSPVQQGGKSSDVLRRNSEGRWLIAIDNPLGDAFLG